ncbi:hypothetical protein LEMLEM_LOCUS8767, partial [Lemmus lemmus]
SNLIVLENKVSSRLAPLERVCSKVISLEKDLSSTKKRIAAFQTAAVSVKDGELLQSGLYRSKRHLKTFRVLQQSCL